MGSLALHEVRRLDGSLVLSVSGIVDDATVEYFEKGLDRATCVGSRQVIVDLSACRLDSAGLAALVRLWRRSGRHSARMRVVAPDAALFRMLELIGLTSQFPTYPTMDAALPLPPAAPWPVAWSREAVATRPARRAWRRRDLAQVHASPEKHGRRGAPSPRRPVRRMWRKP